MRYQVKIPGGQILDCCHVVNPRNTSSPAGHELEEQQPSALVEPHVGYELNRNPAKDRHEHGVLRDDTFCCLQLVQVAFHFPSPDLAGDQTPPSLRKTTDPVRAVKDRRHGLGECDIAEGSSRAAGSGSRQGRSHREFCRRTGRVHNGPRKPPACRAHHCCTLRNYLLQDDWFARHLHTVDARGRKRDLGCDLMPPETSLPGARAAHTLRYCDMPYRKITNAQSVLRHSRLCRRHLEHPSDITSHRVRSRTPALTHYNAQQRSVSSLVTDEHFEGGPDPFQRLKNIHCPRHTL